MDVIIRVCAAAFICCAAVVLIKRYIPEYAPLAQIAASMAVVLSVTEIFGYLISFFNGFVSSNYFDISYVALLFKALAISFMGNFGAELCRDSDNSALAFVLETAAKIAIIALSIPMLKNLAEITAGLMKG